MKTNSRNILIVVLLCWSLASSFAASSFTSLDALPGYTQSYVEAVSGDGKVVVGSCAKSQDPIADGGQAYRWTAAGGMVGLGRLRGSLTSFAKAVSYDGSVIVGASNWGMGARMEAFRWTPAGGMVGLGCLTGGQPSNSWALAVSGDGEVVVGGSGSAQGVQAFRWTKSGGMVGIGFLSSKHDLSVGSAVSKDGLVVVGGSGSTSEGQGFRWTAAKGMMGIGTLRGTSNGHGEAVSGNGSVVVGSCYKAGLEDSAWSVAFRWTLSGGMVRLGDLPARKCSSHACAVSGDGQVVVGSITSAQGEDAFIWDNVNGMRSLKTVLINDHHLDLTAWKLHRASSISADGRTIVGTGIRDGDVTRRAWIAHLDRLEKR